jgi:DNA-binding NarL/FixJ family response regulator
VVLALAAKRLQRLGLLALTVLRAFCGRALDIVYRGGGNVFTLFSQQKLDGHVTISVRSTVRERTTSTEVLRVLWLDDERIVPESSRCSLEANGFHLSVAVDATSGVAQATQVSFDVIILDLRLGRAWGLDVLGELRAAGVAAPVIVLTAYGESDSAFQAGRLGVAAYHLKPLVGSALIQAIRQAAATIPGRTAADVPPSPRGVEVVMGFLLDNSHTSNRSETASRLAMALADPTVTIFEFLALSTCFRANQEGLILHPAARRATASLAQLSRDDLDARLLQAITIIDDAGVSWRSLRAEKVAATVGTEGGVF